MNPPPKPRRLRQHINPLAMSRLAARPPLDLPQDRPIDVELGCGDATFLIERATQEPDTLFVGLDIRRPFLGRGQDALATANLNNLRLETCNLLVDTPTLFAPATIRRFYVNFPDPWFKRRTHNRRWFSRESLGDLVVALVPGGELFVQSDVWQPLLAAFALCEANDALENMAGPWTFLRKNPFGAQSGRESACLVEGRSIWRLLFRKRDVHRSDGCAMVCT